MKLTSDVEFIINTLNSGGYRADVVGGPVRDHLRGVVPTDYDITTSARPNEIKQVFEGFRTLDTGIKHGTVTLILGHTPYEITTYRIDGEYLDARHPKTVSFTDNIEEDLSRRDFTVNAIAYNPKDGMTDLFHGREDIEMRLLRAVGDPYLRFSEDALRILRALRFSATLGFSVEAETAKALREKSSLLCEISGERIYTEWKKLLSGGFAYDVISEFGDVLGVVFPELCVPKLPMRADFADEFIIREAQIFYLSSESPARDFDTAMRRLKTDNKTRTLGVKMLENAGKYPLHSLTDAGVMLEALGEEAALAAAKLDISLNKTEKDGMGFLLEYIERGLPYRLADLAVCGSDIAAMGIKGRDIGTTLSELLSKVVRGSLRNEKQELLSHIKAQKM